MSNFYGGKQGFSFFIVKKYNTISEMESDFTGEEVHYNDYVLISNSDNPFSLDNGKLYRKGYVEFEYVGKISGPPGGVSQIQFYDKIGHTDYAEDATDDGSLFYSYENLSEQELEEYKITPVSEAELEIIPELVAGNAGYILKTIHYTRDGEEIIEKEYLEKDEIDIETAPTSGSKVIDTSVYPTTISYEVFDYNDNIRIAYYNMVKPDGTESIVRVAFQIPYAVFDFEAVKRLDYFEEPYMKRLDDELHPFYYKYEIGLPEGTTGDFYKPYLDTNTYMLYADKYVYGENGEAKLEEGSRIELGAIKDYSGILVGLNLAYYTTSQENIYTTDKEKGITLLTIVSKIIEQLNKDYPYGLGADSYSNEIGTNTINIDLKGKVVVYGDDEGPVITINGDEIKQKWFFGFDYNKASDNNFAGWYYIGSLYSEDKASHNILFDTNNGNNNPTNGNTLNLGGVWFEVEEDGINNDD